jgi:acyl-CoA thioesterase-1
MWRQWAAAVALVGATSCGDAWCRPTIEIAREPARRTPQAQPGGEQPRPRIVILGDSLTAGLGLLESDAYPALLQNKLDEEGYDFEVVNAGVSGDTSAGGLRRLDWALEGDVRILILALGANDALRGLSIPEMKENLSEIIRVAGARRVMVLLAGMEAPPNYGPEYAVQFRQAYRDLAREHRVAFVPFLLQGVAGEARLNQPDGIHPNVDGARIVAETIWRALKPMVDSATAAS